MQHSDVAAGLAEWRRGVAGVVAKARKVDAAELGAEPERLLAVATYDGLSVNPLYTRADERAEAPLPGEFPFLRGRDARRDVLRGWHVAVDIDDGEPARANQRILAALESGATAVRLAAGERGVPVDGLAAALSGVLFELAPVTLAAGAQTAEAARALFAVLDGYACDDRAGIEIALGAAPLTDAFRAGAGVDVDLAATAALAAEAAARAETVRAITVDGSALHDAGASDAQELGASVAAGLEYLRALTDSGLDVQTALRQLEFRFAATDDQFQSIAKFRAARLLWARVADRLGAPAAGDAPQHAVTSAAMLTQRDPWVNLLRNTVAAFGAGLGGADSVTVRRFDAALAPGALGVSDSFAERMARNIQLLLLEESHLGRVLDPAAGSWYVEDLTAGIAAKAWEFMQELERAGGYRAALEAGLLGERVAATRSARESDIAHRRTAVTGVNEFPNLAEKPVAGVALDGVARYGAAFEALRDRSDAYLAEHGARPRILLVPLGPLAEHTVRVTFAANLLASGGIETVDPGTQTADGVAEAVRESGTQVAVLCGADKRYAAEAVETVAALRAAGVRHVLLAGPEKALGERLAAADWPDGFLTLRIDAASTLSDLLGKLGA